MSEEYLRKLGPTLLHYFQLLTVEAPNSWSNHLEIAKRFAVLTARPIEEWKVGAKELLVETDALDDEHSTAMYELVLALRQMAGAPIGRK